MPRETGRRLRVLRDSRGWDKQRVARELRAAAGEHLADTLPKMIGDWEKGRHRPSERYLFLYRDVFPEFTWQRGGAPRPAADPAAVLGQAAGTADRTAALHAAALASGSPGLIKMAGTLADVQRQVDALAEGLAKLLLEQQEEGGGR